MEFGGFDYLGKPERDCAIGETNEDDHIAKWWVLLIAIAVAGLCVIAVAVDSPKINERRYGKIRYKTLGRRLGLCDPEKLDRGLVLLSLSGERKCAGMVFLLFFRSIVFFAVMMLFFQALPEHSNVGYVWAISCSLFIAYYTYKIPKTPTKKSILGSNVEQPPMVDFTPRNVYQDFSAPWVHVIIVFILQFGLFLIYALAAFYDGSIPCFNHLETYTLMWLSIILRAMYYSIDGIYKSKKYFNDMLLWSKIRDTIWYDYKHNDKSLWKDYQDNEKCFVTSWSRDKEDDVLNRHITKWEWKIRYYMEIVINGIMDPFLAFVVIIQAANGDWQDFVFNFVAARFIIELDDYSTWNVDSTFRLRVVGDRVNGLQPQDIVNTILSDDDYKFKALVQTVEIDGETPYSSSEDAKRVIEKINSDDEKQYKDQLINFVKTMETPPVDLPTNQLHCIMRILTNENDNRLDELTGTKSTPDIRGKDAISAFIQVRVLVNKILTVEEYKIQLITLIQKVERTDVPDDESTFFKNMSDDPTFKAQVSDFIESCLQVESLTKEDNGKSIPMITKEDKKP